MIVNELRHHQIIFSRMDLVSQLLLVLLLWVHALKGAIYSSILCTLMCINLREQHHAPPPPEERGIACTCSLEVQCLLIHIGMGVLVLH